MWRFGYKFDKLNTLQPMFPGTTEVDQLHRIFKKFGTLSDTIWHGYNVLLLVKNIVFDNYPPGRLRQKIDCEKLPNCGFVINHLDIGKRITVSSFGKEEFTDTRLVDYDIKSFLEHCVSIDKYSQLNT
ncbi:hypothetical protein HW555_001248 [Spodoptera exigua]|uniref:Uncharacterized protein n=1 Tax=Spodoptera exigua TaxID=7107 RepID=A0A835GTL7_SPOEX|nr:hypothetical protein HW555_001248 [Spodoptera exigua]